MLGFSSGAEIFFRCLDCSLAGYQKLKQVEAKELRWKRIDLRSFVMRASCTTTRLCCFCEWHSKNYRYNNWLHGETAAAASTAWRQVLVLRSARTECSRRPMKSNCLPKIIIITLSANQIKLSPGSKIVPGTHYSARLLIDAQWKSIAQNTCKCTML